MHLTIFGANGPTGRLLTAQALAAGHDVTAFTRRPDMFPIAAPLISAAGSPPGPDRSGRLEVVGGDVTHDDAVDGAVAGADAVLSVLGAPFGRQPVSVYSKGAAAVLAAMDRHGVERFVGVTSSTIDPSPHQDGGIVFRRVIQPFITRVLGRTVYADMRRMEALVATSERCWTVVRPSGLFDHPRTTNYQLATGSLPGRFTARIDLADCLLRLGTDERFARSAVAVTTTEVSPTMVELIWREAIRRS